MTDSERRPEKANNGQASQGDPLLELTRLFASRNRPQLQETGQGELTRGEEQRQDQDNGWNPGLVAHPSGISMTGSVLMGGYGADVPSSDMPESVVEAVEDVPLPEAEAVTEVTSKLSNPANWPDSVWGGVSPQSISTEDVDWSPVDEDVAAPSVAEPDVQVETGYDDEQIFHALAGDLQAEVPDLLPEVEPQKEEPPHNHGFSAGYFGYGQAVQIDVTAAAKRAVAANRPAPVHPSHASPAPVEPAPPVPDFTALDPAQVFAETLHDFDLTIQSEKRRRRPRQQVSLAPLEETEAFELPPLHDDTPPVLPPVHDFPDALGRDGVAGEDHFFAALQPQEKQNSQILAQDREKEDSLYDWGVAVENVAGALHPSTDSASKSGHGRKIFVALSVVLLLGIVGIGGYWLYSFYGVDGGETVLIKAEPGDVKVRAEANAQDDARAPDIAVYNQDGATPSRSSQEALLDGREQPVDPAILAPSLVEPNSVSEAGTIISPLDRNREALDPVDASILAATQRVIPLHIVPTVAIERDEQGNVDIPHRQEQDEVLLPAADYRDQILRQLEQAGQIGQVAQGISAEPENAIGTLAGVAIAPITAETVVETASPNEEESVPTSPPQQQENVASDALDAPMLSPPAIIPIKPPVAERLASNASSQQTENLFADTVVDERFYVQISSQPSRDAAIESAQEVKNRFASLIGNNQVVIVPADIPGRGLYYRVRILVAEQADAAALCERYQAAGGGCFVGR